MATTQNPSPEASFERKAVLALELYGRITVAAGPWSVTLSRGSGGYRVAGTGPSGRWAVARPSAAKAVEEANRALASLVR